jgi:HEAT repeat protein
VRAPPPALLLAGLLAAGCGGPPRKQTAAEWLQENTIILEQLKSYDRKEREQGIRRFLKRGKEQGTEVVVYLLNDPKLEDYRIEVVLARILAEWKDPRAVPYLLRNLRSRDDGAVQIARDGLIVFGEDPRILSAVSDLLNDAEPAPRKVAASLLSEMQGQEAPALLAARLKVEEDSEIRVHCLLGILESRHPRRTEFLIDALSDPDSEIRQMAWEGIARLKPQVTFDPQGDAAARAQGVVELRRWARVSGKTPAPTIGRP